jgi:hypothetical protein
MTFVNYVMFHGCNTGRIKDDYEGHASKGHSPDKGIKVVYSKVQTDVYRHIFDVLMD